MRILADENLESAIVEWLRRQGHDVVWVAESLASTEDVDLLDVALSEQRIVITSDNDFGDLVYRLARIAPGILLLRLVTPDQQEKLDRLIEVWPQIEAQIQGHFTVITARKVRYRRLPS